MSQIDPLPWGGKLTHYLLLLMEVLGSSAAEITETLQTSVASVNSALQRARTTLGKRNDDEPAELTEAQQEMLKRYIAAFESYDVDGLSEAEARWHALPLGP